MILTPLKFNQKVEPESIKGAKFISIAGELVPIENFDLKEFAKEYFRKQKEEITKEKVDEFIKNF